MKSLDLQLPDRMATELEKLVKTGLYHNAQEAICHALNGFLREHSSALTEQHQREDITWALRESGAK